MLSPLQIRPIYPLCLPKTQITSDSQASTSRSHRMSGRHERDRTGKQAMSYDGVDRQARRRSNDAVRRYDAGRWQWSLRSTSAVRQLVARNDDGVRRPQRSRSHVRDQLAELRDARGSPSRARDACATGDSSRDRRPQFAGDVAHSSR